MKVRHFDACIFGTEIGGLVAALLLQKRGTKVVVLARRSNGAFDPGLCEFLCGFSIKPVLKRVGFHPTEVNGVPSLDAPLQLVFPQHRVDCFGDEHRFDRELKREFPDYAPKILHLFKESYGHLEVYQHLFNSRVPLPPKGFFARRQFRKVLETVCDLRLLEDRPFEEELKAFDVGDEFGTAVRAMELALSGLVSPWVSGARLAHLLTLVRWEGYAAPAGVVTFREMLLNKITEKGGKIVRFDELAEPRISHSKITGIRIKGGEWDEVDFRALIVGGEPRGMFKLAPQERGMQKWAEQLNELPIHACKAFQIYRLAPAGIPIGMLPQGLIVPPPAPEGATERRRIVRALRYVVRRLVKPGAAPEVFLALTAFLTPEGNRPDSAVISQGIREVLKRILPFLERHLVEEPSPLYVPTPDATRGEFVQGFVYASETPRPLAVAGIEPETPYKNTFQAGELVFPGLGLDGEIVAGIQSSHLAGSYLSADKSRF